MKTFSIGGNQMRFFLATIVSMAFALSATAQGPGWYAKGVFNDWSTVNPMQDLGGGHYTVTVGTDQNSVPLPANTTYEFKIARDDWRASSPGNNAKVTTNSSG